ncbi:hypothetical protein EHS14_02445 [Schaalia georgiae]|nr:hypothetical protein EHS14_02445 [Schaalia georgiae]
MGFDHRGLRLGLVDRPGPTGRLGLCVGLRPRTDLGALIGLGTPGGPWLRVGFDHRGLRLGLVDRP